MKPILALFLSALCLTAFGQTNVITPSPATLISLRDCSGQKLQMGYNYTKTIANGWGWATNSQPLRAVAASNTFVVHYFGKNGDSGCATGAVTVPWPAPSPKYRFSLSYPNVIGRSNLTIIGFNP